jgi:hypothetical protein
MMMSQKSEDMQFDDARCSSTLCEGRNCAGNAAAGRRAGSYGTTGTGTGYRYRYCSPVVARLWWTGTTATILEVCPSRDKTMNLVLVVDPSFLGLRNFCARQNRSDDDGDETRKTEDDARCKMPIVSDGTRVVLSIH